MKTCPLCGGPGAELGALGSLRHFRCRDCGAGFSKQVKRRQFRAARVPSRVLETCSVKVVDGITVFEPLF